MFFGSAAAEWGCLRGGAGGERSRDRRSREGSEEERMSEIRIYYCKTLTTKVGSWNCNMTKNLTAN